MIIKGIHLDKAGRCKHYHSELDIVALKCDACQSLYACYQCHDSLEDHPFQAVCFTDNKAIACGNCMSYLTFDHYQTGGCPHCKHSFNPNCKKHYSIYFKGASHDLKS